MQDLPLLDASQGWYIQLKTTVWSRRIFEGRIEYIPPPGVRLYEKIPLAPSLLAIASEKRTLAVLACE